MLTIVFLSFHSEHHIKRHILEIDKKFPIIIIDNARNFEFKKEIEEKYSHVKVKISKENLGCCKDLHEQIGLGCIYKTNVDGLKTLLELSNKNRIPIIIESGGNQDEEIKFIKRIIN